MSFEIPHDGIESNLPPRTVLALLASQISDINQRDSNNLSISHDIIIDGRFVEQASIYKKLEWGADTEAARARTVLGRTSVYGWIKNGEGRAPVEATVDMTENGTAVSGWVRRLGAPGKRRFSSNVYYLTGSITQLYKITKRGRLVRTHDITRRSEKDTLALAIGSLEPMTHEEFELYHQTNQRYEESLPTPSRDYKVSRLGRTALGSK